MRLKLSLRVAVLVLLAAIGAGRAAAQDASIVPASYAIYDWLLQERVAGHLPTYDHEVRPMSRATILGHLHTLEALGDKLSKTNRLLLEDYLKEFDTRRLAANRAFTREFFTGLPRSLATAIARRRDPVAWAGFSADSEVSGAVYLMEGNGSLSLRQPGVSQSGYATLGGFKVFANTTTGIGAHIEVDDIWTPDHRALIENIPRYNSEALKPNSTASFAYETFLSYRARKYVEFYLGRGSQSLGAAITEPLVLRPDAPFLGSARLRIGTPYINFTSQVSQLYATPVEDTVVYQGKPIAERVAPQRYMVAHRLTWQPVKAVTFAAHEELVWANRGLELNYVVPVIPLMFMQAGQGDLDNLLAGADLIVRPFDGTELLASITVDDVTATGGRYQKIALFGLEQMLTPALRLGASYTMSDPAMYLHKYRLLAWETHDQPLATELGPNAEEWAARVTAWLPWRTRVMGGYRLIRRGLNPVDANGNVIRNIGGDLLTPFMKGFQARYDGADVHDIKRLELEAQTELIRGLNLSLRVRDDRVTRGNQIPSSRFVDLRLRFGF